MQNVSLNIKSDGLVRLICIRIPHVIPHCILSQHSLSFSFSMSHLPHTHDLHARRLQWHCRHAIPGSTALYSLRHCRFSRRLQFQLTSTAGVCPQRGTTAHPRLVVISAPVLCRRKHRRRTACCCCIEAARIPIISRLGSSAQLLRISSCFD